VNLAGEPLTRKLTDAIYAGSRAQRVYNLYGPSEDTTYSTFTGVAQGETGEPTIGRPIGNTRALVTDRQLLPLPAGVAGELCLGGEGLARGYLGRPATTAERFVPDALSGGSGLRLYRTGDRVRWRNDGELVFLGRFDYLVKVRGFRIELGEVEAALATHPSLHEVVVVVGDDGSGQNILVAYVVGRTSPAPSVAELRAFLDRRLPAFMVPSRFVVLEELPRTPNGKVDRAELPAPTGRSGTAHTAPRSSVETLLTQMWSELLGVERIGIHDDFFAHGGHSLLAMRLITRLRQVFAVELPVRVLFEAPTVARLAAAVAQARRPQGAITAPPIRRRSDDEAPPLTSAQLRFWFLDRWRTGHPAYNVPTALRLTGRLDVSALATALDQIACRHQSLRTTFALVDGEPVQRIAAVGSLPLPMVDLRSLTSSTRASEAHRLANEHGRYPFDLTRGPLASACLVRLADNEHALLFNSHHIIFDGWSIGVLLSELSALYAAFCHHRPSPLPALPVRYSDFARWSRRWFTGAALDDQLSFWRQRLAGIPTRLELPTDRPRPNERRLRGGQIAMTLATRATHRLEALARRHEATVFMILTAALQVLLRRLSGQRTVVVGTPVANRPRPEVEGLIGLFVNTVALRGEVSLESTFVRHLARCRQDALDAYAHQDLPFETLVETLQPDRDPSLTPVFQVALALQNAPLDLRLPELETAPWEVHNGTAQLDLSLSLRPQDGSLEGWIEYDADLFDHTTVQRWAKAYRSLLDAVTADSGGLLGDLSWIDPGERAQLLGEWNDSFAAQPEQRPVDRQIAARAARDPAAIAVSSKAGTLTYGELEGRSNHLAHRLQACGLTAEAVVAVLVEPSLEMVVSLLAILKAGGAYLPLDPVSPAERLAFLIEDSAAPLVVGGKSQLAAIAGRVRTPLLEIDRYGEADAPARASTPPRPTTLDHAAYVIYTSGSTGRPKGVVIHHRGLNNLVAWHRRTYRVAPGDRASQVASPAFDASVWEIWPYLAAGARLEIAPSELRPQPEQLVRWLAARAIDLCFLPTPVAEEALARPLPNDLRLRALLTGGDRLHGGLSAALPFALVNHYGPTESTVLATAGRATGQPEVGTRQPAIGRPVANTRCHVVDRRLQPMPIGVAGELILGGIGLARGYLARPGLTAAQFVPDALDTTPGERLYRTGDRVRCLADGRLDFLGRLDHQVKIRGQRIELGEIEATLVRHPDLQDAVVTSRELPHRRGRQLVAYVVGARAGVPDAETLREFLSRTLPASMVPTAFVALAALPLTNRGKVDRAALRPPADNATGDRDFVPPRSPVEAMVAEVWAELLDRRQVGAHDDFFAIGGHSLAAARALARIRDLTGAEISLHDFFAAPSLADVATAVAQATGQSAGEIPALEPRQHDDNSLLSFAQERLWLLHRLDPASPAYNVPAAIRLSGALDETALERALGEVVTRHQALRTVFPSHNGRPVQKLRSAIGPALATVDLRGLAEEQRRPLATTLAAAESLRPFDLARDPLARFHLLRLGELENLLFVNLHHIVADGWSIGVLVRELGSLYQAFCRGARSPLPPLPVQYIDYACWQRQWLSDDRLAAEIEHWRPRLANAPAALQLPIDRPRPAVQGFRGGRCPMRFGRELTGRLRTLGAASSSTLFMTLLATLHGLLARLCGQQDMVIGAPVANRTEVETEGLIGFFVNTLALRLEAPGDPSFAELLARARTVALDAYAHQHLPFERLVEALAPERDLSRAPLFQVMLVLQNTPAEALELPGLKLELEEIDAA
ncbi:MAG: amino acid adenylation domain-containing protein, partial [Acidobacteriota bacterium]